MSKPDEAAVVARQETHPGAAIARRHAWRLLLVFAGFLLPLWMFGAMVETLREGGAFAFDIPLLEALHRLANPAFDRVCVVFSQVGYAWGTIPADILLVSALMFGRHWREGVFAALSIVGSMALNNSAKHSFARIRPELWPSVHPEDSYSFPSMHAMASMTLALVLVLLCWRLRTPRGWPLRWPVTTLSAIFVVMVGVSRIYLGVHFPSDILAGWTAASIWVVGVYSLVFYGTLKPWQVAAPHLL